MSYSFLSQCIRDGSLVGWWDFRRWNDNYLDLSGSGNDVATISNVWPGGGGVQFADANGYLMVADDTSLQLTQGTLVVLGHWTRPERANGLGSGRLISKRDAGGINYDWLLDNTPELFMYDGLTGVSLVITAAGARTLATTFSHGTAPIGYVDGILVGTYAGGTINVVADDAPLYIGNWYSANRSTYNVIQDALIFNDILTADEMSILHGELMSLPGGEH